MPSPHGCLVAFEGPEGAGKSTHLRMAAEALRRDGYRVCSTAEPGATRLGSTVRKLLLDANEPPPEALAELFLYLADRAQHVAEVIRPALDSGCVVLTDRFSASTLAYQGYGRELDLEMVRRADAWARGGIVAARTILLDCPTAVGLGRAHGADRFHAEERAFHERVRMGFLHLAAADEASWCVIDATLAMEEVHRRVMEAISSVLAAPVAQPIAPSRGGLGG